ncbi:MAG: efflux RND transporter permease subunit [Acidobacteria bacterium]|nr:efflux RND transporter permease subunit [Acidobacteriota bacterium]
MSQKEKNKSALHEIKGQYRLVTERPVAVIMIALAIIVFGWFSYNKLSLNLMPDISYPTLTIRTEFEGSAPEEVESLISRPLEQILAVVRNKTEISSISKAGLSDIILEFTWDTDMNTATQDVRELLEQFIEPDGAERPLVLRYDPTLDPIMRFGLYPKSSEVKSTDLYLIREISEEDLKRDLEAIPGVAAVKVKGGLEEEIIIDLNEKELTNIGLDINQINQRLAAENINLAGGNLEEGDTEYMVRTLNLFTNLDEIANLIVSTRNGAEIRLKDIGRVYMGHKEREVITHVNGKESVELEIYKEADANIVQLAQTVRERVFGTPLQQAQLKEYYAQLKKKAEDAKKPKTEKKEEKADSGQNQGRGNKQHTGKPDYIQAQLPENIDIALLSDQSTFIKQSIDEVKSTALFGGIFAIAVLFFFLRNGYSTFIIALSIPISVVATFAPMNIFSVTLNMMSLGGLALGIGMLVDNSIVVLESIYRCREEGDEVVASAIRGASEVGGAVTASTLTTISVFLPIVFVEGVAGQLFGDLSLTVVFSLIMSLIAALFFIPMLASRDFKKMSGTGKLTSPLLISKTHNFILELVPGWREENTDDNISFVNALKNTVLGVIGIILTFVEVFLKICLIFLSFAYLIFKFMLLPAVFILLIIYKIVMWVTRHKFSLWKTMTDIANSQGILPDHWLHNDDDEFKQSFIAVFIGNIFSAPFIRHVWQDLLSFTAWETAAISARNYGKTLGKKLDPDNNRFTKLFWIITLPLYPVVYSFISLTLVLNYFMQVFLKFSLLLLLTLILFGKNFVNLFIYFIRGILAILLFGFDKGFEAIRRSYPGFLRASIRNKKAVLASVVVLFAFTIFVILPGLGSELIPEVHQGEFNVEMRMPVGTPLESTDEHIKPMDEFINGLDGIDIRATVVGAEKTASTDSEEGEHTAKITVRLATHGNLAEKEEALVEMIRDRSKTIPQLETNISRPAIFSFKTPIEVEISGFNLDKLKNLSKAVVTEMEKIEGLYDVRSNIQPGNPEIQITYDRERLAKHGLDISVVAQTVRNKVLGYVPTKFNKEDRKIEIRVKVEEADRNTLDELAKLNIAPSSQVPIPLSAVADLNLEEGPAEIRRIEQQRSAVITANVSGLDLGTAAEQIMKHVRNIQIPSDFSVDISGQNKEMEISMRSLMMAMLLAIFLVYTVMAMLFESIIQPFIIILTIPLALIGVVLVLWIGGIPLSVVVGIGAIVLIGIVVNNAIVLVDYTNTLRKRGIPIIDAVVEAGSVRLRPILMTTATTVLGLLPMAMGLGEGAEIRTPMAWTIIAGLLSATLLTLVIIPTVYISVEGYLEKRKANK